MSTVRIAPEIHLVLDTDSAYGCTGERGRPPIQPGTCL